MAPGIQGVDAKPALVMGRTGETTTFGDLKRRSGAMARLLSDRGLRPGDHLAIVLENRPEMFEICWGAQRLGLYYTPVNVHLTADEVAYIVGDCGARAVVVSASPEMAGAALVGGLTGPDVRLAVGGPLPGCEDYGAALASAPAAGDLPESEGAAMYYSSGTTGRPKGVKRPLPGLPFGTRTPMIDMVVDLYGFDDSTVYLSPAPLYHAAPLWYSMTVQRLGGTVVVMEEFDARQALALIERHRVTHAQFVPTMFVRMLKLPAAVRTAYDLSSLRVAIHAAAPCPVEVKAQMMEWWGPVLYEYYSGTEGVGYTLIGPEEWLAHPGSVGRSLQGAIHIVDQDGNELGPGQTGTVYFETDEAFEYHNDPDKTAAVYNHRGWATLGDVGYVDAEGYLYLTDRLADMVVSGGVNIYPQEAENVLVTHPAVVDVAVFGIPNEEFGEEMKAVVQPTDAGHAGPDLEAELLDYCRARLAHYKCPRSIDFEAELPRLPTGKLYKRVLKDRYWAGHRTRIL